MNNKALILDLVEWIAGKPRTYSDVMKAWRTSCPRLPIWEDAVDLGLVCRSGHGTVVRVTSAGLALLSLEGRGLRLVSDTGQIESEPPVVLA